MRYAVVKNNVVENMIAWNGVSAYTPPPGTILVQSDIAGPGWTWDGSNFTAPVTVEPTPTVPASITPRQCRLILMAQGLLPTVEAMIAQQDEATRITWEYALEFKRNDPLLTQLAANLNLTSEQIDQFFIAASQL